jgi:hypothetical protein
MQAMRSRKLNKTAAAVVFGWFAFWCIMALIAFALSGCAAPVRQVSQPLPLPERPLLPRVYESELACLSDESYRRIVERERLRREYAETLETIIRATQQDQ